MNVYLGSVYIIKYATIYFGKLYIIEVSQNLAKGLVANQMEAQPFCQKLVDMVAAIQTTRLYQSFGHAKFLIGLVGVQTKHTLYLFNNRCYDGVS